ncbi:hypothetical protein Lal_00004302 [Lupinus albus]|nr:hypothetical protein Lal_00004302 [Lupinus albus]
MNQMWHVRGSQSLLPYAIFITKILEHFSVPLESETKVALNLRESKVDIEVVHKMGFVIDPVTCRTYKHRTDRQPAPTDELEPTAAPHQPESHAQSSASATMPTNQMIMDELVSLRGYITTRMDAFDTQSHQIHYELHRLSSRLSNMDVDEDSFEPDQKGEKSWEAHNPKRKGEHTYIHIGGAYSRQVKIYHQSWKPRLSESCLAWARNGNFGLLTQCNRLHTDGNRLHRIKSIRYVHLTQCNRLHSAGNRLHSAGNRLHSAGNRLHSAGNRLHSAGNRLHSSGNQLHSASNRLHTSGNRLHRIKSIRYAHFSRCNRLHHVGNRLQPDDTSLKQKPKHIFELELRREERNESFSRARSLRTHLGA